jgi:hypothetical protein
MLRMSAIHGGMAPMPNGSEALDWETAGSGVLQFLLSLGAPFSRLLVTRHHPSLDIQKLGLVQKLEK